MRNTQRRVNHAPNRPTPKAKRASSRSILHYEVPTEFVDLPSRGIFYDENHPFHQKESIEIRMMTAKEEDILSSQSLITKGIALDRFFESIIVEDVDTKTLLNGDRSAIMIAARISGYGFAYEANITCPNCGNKSKMVFNLQDKTVNDAFSDKQYMSDNNIVINSEGLIELDLPISKFVVFLKMLNSYDQEEYLSILADDTDTTITTSLNSIIHRINDCEDREQIATALQNLPAKDSKYIRDIFSSLTPKVELKRDFACGNCFHKQSMEVPLSAAFFWPK